MSNEYTRINVQEKDPEFLSFDEEGGLDVDLDDDNTEEEVTENTSDSDTVEEGDEDRSVASEDEKETSESRKKKSRQYDKRSKKVSRSEKRIKELLEEREQLARELDSIKKQTKEQLAKTKTNARASKEAVKEGLGSQIENIKKQLRKAIEEGDSESVVDLQTSLHDTQIKLAAVTYELQGEDEDDYTDTVEQEARQQKQPVKGPSEKALAWVDEHPEFNSDPVFHGAAMMVNNTLIREGYNPDSVDFYEELNDRLSTRFPEIFDNEDEDDVEYTRDTSEDEDIDEEQRTKNKPSKKTTSRSNSKSKSRQTTHVSGASRPVTGSAGKARQQSNRNTVKLSPTDVELAKKWGIPLESFARRKKLYESRDKDSSEYVPINIG